MKRENTTDLSKRERQIMDILYWLESASAADVQKELPDPPSYSATRALLGILVNKGHAVYYAQGNKYIYRPKVSKKKAASSAMKRVVNTFYEGSFASAAAGLLESSEANLNPEEIERLANLIKNAEKKSSAKQTNPSKATDGKK